MTPTRAVRPVALAAILLAATAPAGRHPTERPLTERSLTGPSLKERPAGEQPAGGLPASAPPPARLRVARVEPPNWWTGMASPRLQLMIYGDGLADASARCASPDLSVRQVHRTGNPRHLFVDVDVAADASPGSHRVVLTAGPDSAVIAYPILRRQPREGRHQGFGPADVLYLITPDRFANGDPRNDTVPGMPDVLSRADPLGRHGGDLQGILDHLDDLAELGVTTLWINPLVENNNPHASYHGYAATDLYRIDPRFGDNTLYSRLVTEAHRRGLKIVMDHVSNHVSIHHPWIADLPAPGWLNGTIDRHTLTRHAKIALTDPHADSLTRAATVRGWFADHMPDLNQENPLLGTYLIQNTIWWIETTGLDGVREDTWPYADRRFLAAWTAALLREYPALSIVGEVWINDPAFLAPYQRGSALAGGPDTGLPSVTDFGLFEAMMRVFGGGESIRLVYDCLAKDHLYPDPARLLTFLDNHDVRRIIDVVRDDERRFRQALLLLLTTRGTPQLFYGTEIGLRGGSDHGRIRADFPGGFPGDTVSAWSPEGRTERQRRLFDYTRALLRARRRLPALREGRLVHFPPEREVYVYVREAPDGVALVYLNNSPQERDLPMEWVTRRFPWARRCRDPLTGAVSPCPPATAPLLRSYDAGLLEILP